MVTSHRQHGDHFEMYRDTESLCCITGNNVVLQADYTSKTKRLIEKEAGGRDGENSMKVVKWYELSAITQISTGGVEYNMTNVINTVVCYI